MIDGGPLTVEDIRRKARDRTPVLWPGMAVGRVTRVARDGTWADMEWALSLSDLLYSDRTWRKRQSLTRASEWRHA